ncbi:replicative DNA helicase [Streptomyces bathyalis]|uniref:Replicative DNA helicase n=1 Tax=Streptomyces bathyalis TaxID=2710756 RepID=A0A7T1T2H2_9ACTN|nr:DnaB-like helicase N-terminal domain-containing protein [Streptomyces bathyalis]QPP05196.1 replicative DNA helicase [Streptomyces bathyalis]
MPHTPETDDEDLNLEPPPEPPVHYAEQALLGALLLEPEQLAQTEGLLPEHFRSPAHRAVYAAMRTLTPPEREVHRTEPVWINAVLTRAVEEAPGVSAAYLHTCIGACPRPQHATSYARMIRSDHARRTLREHAIRLEQAATNTTLADPESAALRQADALARFVDELTRQTASHPGSLPRTPLPPDPPRDRTEDALEEERLFLATATDRADGVKELPLRLEDFALPLHGHLYQCLSALTRRGEDIDPIAVLWEAQHRRLLTSGVGPDDVLTLLSQPAGSPEHWAEQILRRALLYGARRAATRIRAFAEDTANSPHQLITGARRALADLTAQHTRCWHRAPPGPNTTAEPAHSPTVKPRQHELTALHASRGNRR